MLHRRKQPQNINTKLQDPQKEDVECGIKQKINSISHPLSFPAGINKVPIISTENSNKWSQCYKDTKHFNYNYKL